MTEDDIKQLESLKTDTNTVVQGLSKIASGLFANDEYVHAEIYSSLAKITFFINAKIDQLIEAKNE